MLHDAVILSSKRDRISCPWCGPSRKNKHDLSLSLKRAEDGVLYNCWHCSAKGIALYEHNISANKHFSWEDGLDMRIGNPEPTGSIKLEKLEPLGSMGISEVSPAHISSDAPKDGMRLTYTALSEAAYLYLEGRGISRSTADNCGLKSVASCWFRRLGASSEGLAFPYTKDLKPVGYKIRSLAAKDFSFDGESFGLFLHEQPGDGKEIIICEGCIDALSFREAGLTAYSLPHGAINSVDTHTGREPASGDDSKKLKCLAESQGVIDGASRIILATDGDKPGLATSEELARRIGKEKCWVVGWPDGAKDANDIIASLHLGG